MCWLTEFGGPYGRSRLWKNHSGSPRQQTTSITAIWPTNTDALPANVSLREHGSGYLILPHGMRAEPITSKRGALGQGPSSVPMRSAPAVDPANGRGPALTARELVIHDWSWRRSCRRSGGDPLMAFSA